MPEKEDNSYLLDFYGTECPHCIAMEPMIKRVEKELGVKIKKVEVWHNSQNAALWKKLDQGKCGGVPFFFHTRTKKWICGEASYEEFKKWASGK
jgi:thiol-disulfide isomerase/thioredoxin